MDKVFIEKIKGMKHYQSLAHLGLKSSFDPTLPYSVNGKLYFPMQDTPYKSPSKREELPKIKVMQRSTKKFDKSLLPFQGTKSPDVKKIESLLGQITDMMNESPPPKNTQNTFVMSNDADVIKKEDVHNYVAQLKRLEDNLSTARLQQFFSENYIKKNKEKWKPLPITMSKAEIIIERDR